MMNMKMYIKPEIEIVPYFDKDILDYVPGGNNQSFGTDDEPLAKDFDMEEESEFDDMWEEERQTFGLQDWDANYDD